MRALRHRLGTTGNNDIGITGDDCLSTQNNRLDTRRTDFIHRRADGLVPKTSADGTLSGWILAKADLKC